MKPPRMAAFVPKADGGWEQTPEAKNVLGIIKASGGKPFNIQPAPSPLAGLNGEGMWGTGGGVHRSDIGDTYVDPVNGSVSTAAHEAGHASFPTELMSRENQENAISKMEDYASAATPGNRLRTVYETLSKPILLEEANAQGVARAAVDKAGYGWENSGWKGIPMEQTGLSDDIRPELAYPGEYRFGGQYDEAAELYSAVEGVGPGPVLRGFSPEEQKAVQTTRNSLVPAMNRQFERGYNLIK